MTMKRTKSCTRDGISFEFEVYGDPIAAKKVTETAPTIWCEYKQARFNFMQHIKNQFDCRQPVDGPIQIETIYYVLPSCTQKTINLFNFTYHSLKGVIFKNNCTISEIKLKKIKDKRPRTRIKIKRLA